MTFARKSAPQQRIVDGEPARRAGVIHSDQQITGLPVVREIVGEGADRLPELVRVFHGDGHLDAVGFVIRHQLEQPFGGQHLPIRLSREPIGQATPAPAASGVSRPMIAAGRERCYPIARAADRLTGRHGDGSVTLPDHLERAPPGLAGPPLKVLRFFPFGDVAAAPYLSVTFDQPMIPAASRADVAPEQAPVKLTPAIPGRWRWLGADTLLFEAGEDHARHLPMATLYGAAIAAGTTSASGAVLRESVQWSFRTPAPTLRKHPLYRRRSYGPLPVLFAAFDQRIDPSAVLGHVRLLVEDVGSAHAVRLATAAEIAADAKVQRLVDATPPGHWLAVIPCEPLPTIYSLTLTFVPGTPSAEGPLVTTRSQGFRFGIRGPLALSSHRSADCAPGDDWTLIFTNHVDAAAFDPASIAIEPELDRAKVTLFRHTDPLDSWTGLKISGNRRPQTGYRVTVRAGLKDVFGQTLPEDMTAYFQVGGLPPSLAAPWGEITVLDPANEPAVAIETVNLDAVQVWAFRVEPSQFPDYLRWRSTVLDGNGLADPPDDPPGVPVLGDVRRIEEPGDTPTETVIDLGGVLGGAPGHLILEVRAADPRKWQARPAATWIQATRLGIVGLSDRGRMLVWISRLADGAARSGAGVELLQHETRAVTDAAGVARLPAPAAGTLGLVVARDREDSALLPVESHAPGSGDGSEVRIFAFSDRHRYRPGQTVFVKGWVRRLGGGPAGDVGLLDNAAARRIEYRVRRHYEGRPPAAAGSAGLGPLGGFHFQFKVPEDLEPGRAVIVLSLAGRMRDAADAGHGHPILVRERVGRRRLDVDTPPNREPDPSWRETVLAVAAVGAPRAGADPRPALRLVADRDRYLPGQCAEITVETPFACAEGMLTLCRDGIISGERFTMDTPAHVLRVPIEERYVPNLHLRVDLIGSAPGGPVHCSAMLNLPVAPVGRTLRVTVTPSPEAVRPGAAGAIELTVRDAAGAPVADAELAVMAVAAEETAPGDDTLPDPVAAFYCERDAGVRAAHSREHLLPPGPRQPAEEANAGRGGARADPEADESGAVDAGAYDQALFPARADAPHGRVPVALYVPEVRTGADGRATVSFTAPASEGCYRLIAVAAAGERLFGAGEASCTVGPPLTVRAVAPPFLTLGDRAELTAALRNRTAAAMTVRLAASAANAELTTAAGEAAAGCTVTVPARGQVEACYLAAPTGGGDARIRFTATADERAGESAETTITIPVRNAASDAFVLHGSIAAGDSAQYRLRLPKAAAAGSLEASLANTAFQALTDAFLAVWRCSHSGPEPIASRVLAAVAVGGVLEPFAGLPAPQAIAATLQQDLQALHRQPVRDRRTTGAPDGCEPALFCRVHTAHALARASRCGHAAPTLVSPTHLRDVKHEAARLVSDSVACRSLEAYALYVRTLLGDPDPAAAAWLFDVGVKHLTLEAVGWLLFALAGDSGQAGTAQEIIRLLGDRRAAAAGAAAIDSRYRCALHHAESRTDAVLLEALIAAEAPGGLIAEQAQRLLAHRVDGRWAAPQENVWALLALRRYFGAEDIPPPAVDAQVRIGDRAAGGGALRGGAVGATRIEAPLADLRAALTDDGEVPVVVRNAGEAALHYRLGLNCAPTDPLTGPAEEGIAVVRNYEPVDADDDVRRGRDGGWLVRAGSRVRVRLTLTASDRLVHVVLIDPLPAGLEPLGLAPLYRGEHAPGWWKAPWFEHRSLCEEHAEATASVLPAGVHEYRYLARAATRGAYVAPPATAEQRYAPQTFGHSAADRVVVA